MNLWVVGKHSGQCSDWELQGVFDSYEKAIAACEGKDRNWFIGPVELNKVAPDETTKWVGLEWPNV